MVISPNSSSFLIPCSSLSVVPSSSTTHEKFQAEILAVTGASSLAQVNYPQLVPSVTAAGPGPLTSQITLVMGPVSGKVASCCPRGGDKAMRGLFDRLCPSVDVRVEYPWLPTTCNTCNKRGHTSHNCKSRKDKSQPNKKEWVKVAEMNKRKQPDVSCKQVNDVPNVESALHTCHELLPVQKGNQPVKPFSQNEPLLTAQGETTVSLMEEQGPIEKQNSLEALALLMTSRPVLLFRRRLWDELVALSRVLPEVPWILGADFNEVRYLQERSDWIQNMHFSKDSELFNDRLSEAELSDLPAFGPKFTWSNKRIEGLSVKKLDRLLVNSTWFSTFPRTRAEFLPPDISDHCAGSEVWSSVTVSRYYMFQLCKKLKALKAPLQQLNKDCYSDLQGRIQQETSKLHAIQIDLLANPHEDLVLVEQEQARRVAKLSLVEEAFLKQKSRVHWLSRKETKILLTFIKSCPSKMTDSRPISCCNLIYKCITKIIANRLKRCLPLFIIAPTNVLLLKANGGEYTARTRVALEALSFPPTFINWIKACITSLTFSVALNGNLEGYFLVFTDSSTRAIAVDLILRQFYLATGRAANARGAKVSWAAAFQPKMEGRLGLKPLHNWNVACILQFIELLHQGYGGSGCLVGFSIRSKQKNWSSSIDDTCVLWECK
ncbi:hypothetical protein SLEP1_g24740 [Rubroshorea leprosula]|uniref:CCHC-type domain-containing protein n=1 Tax=Rubroshorea leprosula TaxID=152421 RepID=A0AAV5JQC6_9ROSI|nr:hypothetical protein SLEP1_g24740 [Rubroshorea leprosula]